MTPTTKTSTTAGAGGKPCHRRRPGIDQQPGGVDPGVALTGISSMAGTGMDAIPITVLGVFLFVLGFVGRRTGSSSACWYSMRRLALHRRLVLTGLAVLVSAGAWAVPAGGGAAASPSPAR